MPDSVQPAQIIVRLGVAPPDKHSAIAQAAQIMAQAGWVDEKYGDSLMKREATANTYLGHGVAIPHGTLEDKGRVRHDGLVVLQVPDGVSWGPDQAVHLIVAIAAAGDGHIAILRRLAGIIQDEALITKLSRTSEADDIIKALTGQVSTSSKAEVKDFEHTLEWTLDYPAGLHARPATAWVEKAKSLGLPMLVRHEAEGADPRNLVSLLQLGLKNGDNLVFSAQGPGAEAALLEFRRSAAALSTGEKAAAQKAAAQSPQKNLPAWEPPDAAELNYVAGAPASPGLAVGKVLRLDAVDLNIPDQPVPLAEGGQILEEALSKTKHQLKAVIDDASRRLGASDAAIFKAQSALLDDSTLIGETARLMVEGHGPAWSWHQAVEKSAADLAGLGNAVLAARAGDLRDVGRRVLANLIPDLEIRPDFSLAEGANIIVAQELTPSDTAGLDPKWASALATAQGGPTSHTAILARTLGLPAVVAAGERLLAAQNGDLAIVDGDGGRIWLKPSEGALAAARQEMEKQAERRAEQAERRALPAKTQDGYLVEVAANINNADQAPLALEMGAESVGLMRTEFLFLERGERPDEDEQYETYLAISKAMEGRTVIVRALDIGGDKQVPYLQLPHEDNPFLGVRGARLLLRRSDLFEPQMRALYRAAKDGAQLMVMFPMITSLREVRDLKIACEEIRQKLSAPPLELGIMIEVPAAALMSNVLAEEVDFFSIGTNDLTQYTLAMDRQNPQLAPEADSLCPAVLQLIKSTVDGAAKRSRMVGVCGGIAGDPFGAAILAGLGVNELSMTPRDIPLVKDVIREHSQKQLTDLAAQALACDSAEAVRALAAEFNKGRA